MRLGASEEGQTTRRGYSREAKGGKGNRERPRPYRFLVIPTLTAAEIPPPPSAAGLGPAAAHRRRRAGCRGSPSPRWPGTRTCRSACRVRDVGGVGLCTTDLVNARAILKGSPRTMELLATCPEDRPLAVQIYGGKPDDMADGREVGRGLRRDDHRHQHGLPGPQGGQGRRRVGDDVRHDRGDRRTGARRSWRRCRSR